MDKRLSTIINHRTDSEKVIERHLVEAVESLGGIALKYYNPGAMGYPDRLAIFPGGQHVWIELKSRGKHPTPLQSRRHTKLRALGAIVAVCDSIDSVNEVIARYGVPTA